MGFHKRFITKDTILLTSEEQLDTLFSSDALLFGDEWSSEFYDLFRDGIEYNKILEKLKNYENDN